MLLFLETEQSLSKYPMNHLLILTKKSTYDIKDIFGLILTVSLPVSREREKKSRQRAKSLASIKGVMMGFYFDELVGLLS